jgi:hypothetical protein
MTSLLASSLSCCAMLVPLPSRRFRTSTNSAMQGRPGYAPEQVLSHAFSPSPNRLATPGGSRARDGTDLDEHARSPTGRRTMCARRRRSRHRQEPAAGRSPRCATGGLSVPARWTDTRTTKPRSGYDRGFRGIHCCIAVSRVCRVTDSCAEAGPTARGIPRTSVASDHARDVGAPAGRAPVVPVPLPAHVRCTGSAPTA